jgi:hypothetical protein
VLGSIAQCKENIQAAFALQQSINGGDDIDTIAIFVNPATDLEVESYTFQY